MRNDFESNYLMHHGILGQKWGIRNYQNPDGSLTEAGRKRYGVGPGRGVGDINTKEGAKKREKDLKKAIKINNKKRGKEYSKIANNPENFLGLNKKHAAKISEYSDYIKKGEEELKRLKILQDDLNEYEKAKQKAKDYDKNTKWDEWDEQISDDLWRASAHKNPTIHKEDANAPISSSRLNDGFGKIPKEWSDVYSGEEASNVSFSIQQIGKNGYDGEVRINNYNSGISNEEAAKQTKEFLNTFDDAKARKAIAEEFYPRFKSWYPDVKISQAQFENAIEAYSVDTYPKYGTYEVHYDDGGLLGGHSLDIEGDMKTGKIKNKSMNG